MIDNNTSVPAIIHAAQKTPQDKEALFGGGCNVKPEGVFLVEKKRWETLTLVPETPNACTTCLPMRIYERYSGTFYEIAFAR